MFEKYNRIDTQEKLLELDKFLMDGDTPRYPLISVDTETNGLLLYKTVVVGFSLSINSDQGFYIPFLDWTPDPKSLKTRSVDKVKYQSYMDGHFTEVWTGKTYPEFVTPKEYRPQQFLIDLIQRWFDSTNLLMHNAPFDVNMIWSNTGVDLKDQVFMDTSLLKHIINENTPSALKSTANEWKEELGINPYAMANQEQQELTVSIIENGGKKGMIWRSKPEFMTKYACADTFLTYGVYEVGLNKFLTNFDDAKHPWLFNEEVMPLCREVVIPMKRRGVYLDVPYFQKLQVETKAKMDELEDKIIEIITPHLADFTLGKSIDEAISNQRLIKHIIKLEGLKIPEKYDKKTDTYKQTIAKGEVKKVYQKDPHWIWGYILGEDEIKYPKAKLDKIKKDLYIEIIGKRHRFNIGSDAHLRWLFCDKLGFSKTALPQTEAATKENPIPSVKAEVLKEYILPAHEWVKYLLTFKKLRKSYSTYVVPAVELNIDGWLYMDMRQNGTTSGRFACRGGFNLQTLPRAEELECTKCGSADVETKLTIELLADIHCKECGNVDPDITLPSAIKKGFIAPPGYKIINADYSSLEPRCFAYMSGDDKLKEVYWSDLDLYSKVYCDIFDKEGKYSADPKADNFLKKVYKKGRTLIKPVVLGIPYGAQDVQVAALCNYFKDKINYRTKLPVLDDNGKPIQVPDVARGKETRRQYLDTYPNLTDYMLRMETQAVSAGYVESLVGRRRHFKYCKIIREFLISKGLEYTDMYDTAKYMFNGKAINKVSEHGNALNFSSDDLKTLCDNLGLKYPDAVEKGGWVYIRALLVNDLNNAKNFPIQSLAGHITNRGMLDTTRLFKQNNSVDSWICLQVHDEIMGYTKIEDAERSAECLKVGMEDNAFAKLIDIKMIADPTICDSVKEAK